MSSLAALQGCGDDEDDDGGGGKGGTSGAAGEAGDGGTSGSAGTGATGGTAGGGRGGTGGQTGGTGGSVSGAGGAPGGAGGEGGNGEGGAGPDRVQACTDYCQGYNDKDCEEAAANTYDDEADCRDVCNASSWELGDPGDASGNSIHCRLTHTGLAAAPNPGPDEVHCGHASENSTGQCVD